MRALIAILGCLMLASASFASDEPAIVDCSHIETDGSRTLCHEAVLPAAASEVWALFANSEGLRSWAAPIAAIDLRIGGMWESSYDPHAQLGDPGNIVNRVLSFAPERMLSIAVERAPPGFPEPDLVRRVWTVIEIAPVDARRARVRVSMLGYGQGAGFDRLYAMFARGNALTLEHLDERVRDGATDWSAAFSAPPAHP